VPGTGCGGPEIYEVTKQHEALEEKMMQVEGSTEEKFLDLKNSLKGEFEEATAESKEKEGACDQAPAAGLARPTHCKQQPCTFG
jgi:hypothetical protein